MHRDENAVWRKYGASAGRLCCCPFLLLTDCSLSKEPKEKPLYNVEMTDENSMEVTLVNASGYPVREFLTWWDGDQDGFDLLHNSGRNLKPDESITVRIPRCETGVYSFLAKGPNLFLYGHSFREIPEGGIVVLLPNERYDDEIQTIFEAGADAETVKETVFAQYQAACEAEPEAAEGEEKRQEEEKWERLANLSQEEIDEAVKLPGYNSLADMRTKKNPDITFSDFGDEYEMDKHRAYYQLYGYWYPNGDRNSLTYIGITNQEFMWYQFDPEQGDVQLGKMRLAASSGGVYKCTFTLADGNKFTVEYTSLSQELSAGTLTFEDCTKQYSDNAEYYYSERRILACRRIHAERRYISAVKAMDGYVLQVDFVSGSRRLPDTNPLP